VFNVSLQHLVNCKKGIECPNVDVDAPANHFETDRSTPHGRSDGHPGNTMLRHKLVYVVKPL